MAIVYAAANDNWSTVGNWLTVGGIPYGMLPQPNDDVYANGKTIQLDVDVTVNTLRNTASAPIVAGGIFNHSASADRSITATNGFYAVGSTAAVLSVTSNTPYTTDIAGDLMNNGRWFTFAGTGNINFTGNMLNGWTGGYNGGGIYSSNTGVVNLTGIYFPGTYFAAGIQYNNWSFYNAGVGTVNITGSINGNNIGYCVVNASTGQVNLTGTATSGSAVAGYAIYSTTAGYITVIGTVDTQVPPTTVTSAIYLTTGTLYFSGIAINRSERPAIDTTKMILLTSGSTTWTFQDSGVGFKNLYTADLPALGNPLPANVRKNIAYGPVGELSGTAYMPSASSVLLNVPFDVASFGTLLMTPADFWAELLANITTPNSIGMRLKDCATVDSTGTQIASLT